MKTSHFSKVACNFLAVALVISCSNGGNQDYLPYSSKNENVSSSSFENGDKISSSSFSSSSKNENISSSSFENGDKASSSSFSSSSFVQNSSSSSNLMPCGSGFFNSATQFCLNGNTITELCGGDAYSVYQFCANDKVYDLCGGIGYNPANYICCNNVQYDINTYSCCNNKQYFLATQFCNENSILNKCGGIQYNPLENSCCVSAVFDLANQRCKNSVVETKCGANNWYDAANTNLRCENDVVEAKCGTSSWYDDANANLRCENDVVEAKCGTSSWYDIANTNLRCENNIVETRCGVSWYNAEMLFCSNDILVVKDSRDNQTYKIATIGTQTWMAQNLNYKASGSKCYDSSEANCTIYGRLYSDATARNVCPSGWHLPSNDEWNKLLNFVNPDCPAKVAFSSCGGPTCANAGTKLKATKGWDTYGFDGYGNWNAIGIAGTDDFGFAALPGGVNYSSTFENIGKRGEWWSADFLSGAQCCYRMFYSGDNVSSGGSSGTSLSVRCVKD